MELGGAERTHLVGLPRSEFQLQIGILCDRMPRTALTGTPYGPGPGSLQLPPVSQVPVATPWAGWGRATLHRPEHLYSSKTPAQVGRPFACTTYLPLCPGCFSFLGHLLLFPSQTRSCLLGTLRTLWFATPGLGFSSEHGTAQCLPPAIPLAP